MRTTRPSVFVTTTAGAAMLLLLLSATKPTRCSAPSSEFRISPDDVNETCRTPVRYAAITKSKTMGVATTATPAFMVNASYNSTLIDDFHDQTVSSQAGYTLLPHFQSPGVGVTTTNQDGSVTPSTTTTTSIKMRSSSWRSTTPTIASTRLTSSDATVSHTSSTNIYGDNFGGVDEEDSNNEYRWTRFRHELLLFPDQFIPRFLNALMYLAEVITADVISAFLFGRWRPRYYQRASKNRLNRKRRRRLRRFMMNVIDMGMTICDACMHFPNTLCLTRDDMSRPSYQMISNVQLTEYPATLSTFANVPTSEVMASFASAWSSSIDTIAYRASRTSQFPELPALSPPVAQGEAATAEQTQVFSTLESLLPKAPKVSAGASCHLSASLPCTALEIHSRPAVSPFMPLVLPADLLTTVPSLLSRLCLPESGQEETRLRAARPLTTTCPLGRAFTDGYDETNTRRPVSATSNEKRDWLAGQGIGLLLEGSASPYPPTSKALRQNRPSIVAAEANCWNDEGLTNTLARYNIVAGGVTTAVERFDDKAGNSDELPPAPFFVSEHYTPENTCYVSDHGVAYTTIVMSYVHRFNLPTTREAQEDSPTYRQIGDVSDVIYLAANARMRCKWSRACIQTSSSEYYRSSVEAVFVSRFIPDEADMMVLNGLVTKYI